MEVASSKISRSTDQGGVRLRDYSRPHLLLVYCTLLPIPSGTSSRVVGKRCMKVSWSNLGSRFFLNKALGKYNYFDDLEVRWRLYGNLVRLKQ